MPNDFRPEAGHRFEFRSQDGKQRIACKVLELQEPSHLSFSWDGGEEEPPAVVSVKLKPDGDGGTHLTLEHAVLEEAELYVLIEARMNWQQALRRVPVPIVYVGDEPEEAKLRHAGFRNREEEPACK